MFGQTSNEANTNMGGSIIGGAFGLKSNENSDLPMFQGSAITGLNILDRVDPESFSERCSTVKEQQYYD